MSFENLAALIEPEQRAAARQIYDALAAAQGPVDPEIFLARLQAQGLVDDATVRRYQPDETIDLTVVRPYRRTAADTTVVVAPAARSKQPSATPADAASREPVQGFGLSAVNADFTPSRYSLLGRLSAGAMGEIQLAKDRDLRRKVAYKQLLTDVEAIPGLTQRFLLEAQVMAQLDHPNVVPVYSLEQVAEGRFAYAMKLVRGQTLASLIKEAQRCVKERRNPPTTLSRETLLDHFLKVCDAMTYAHAKGVLHRDLKPANIMIGQFREVYVMDWGLARVAHAPDQIGAVDPDELTSPPDANAEPTIIRTRIGEVMGTPSYMSPEQASGDNTNLDARSDIYALGLILFELVSLQRALCAPSLDAAMQMAQHGEKLPLKAPSASLNIPRELSAIIAKATATRRQERYQTVDALADDLRRFLQDQPVTALPDTRMRQLLRWIGHHRQATLQIVLSVLLVAISTLGWNFYQRALALTEIQAHKERLSFYLTSVAERNHAVDRHFLFFEELLEGLASAVVQARLHGTATPEQVYWAKDYRTPDRAPPDLAAASRYRGKLISTEYPVYVSVASAAPTISTLQRAASRTAALRHPLRRLFLLDGEQALSESTPLNARQVIGEQERPLKWAYFALREGLLVVYPGQDAADLPAGYDPQQHPWYRDAAGKSTKVWGNPYQDQLGQGLLLSCSMSLFDEAGQVLGVAGIDISLDYVIERLMTIPDPHVIESFLLDRQGQIVVRSSDRHRDPAQIEARTTQQPALYLHPEIVADVRAGHFGYREISRDGREVWIVYDDIETLGWAYVVEFAPNL